MVIILINAKLWYFAKNKYRFFTLWTSFFLAHVVNNNVIDLHTDNPFHAVVHKSLITN